MKTTEPIRNKQQIRKLADYFISRGQLRNHVLFIMGVHTALRVSDLLRITCDDVYDFKSECKCGRGCVSVRESITITEKKTGKTKTIPLHENVIAALQRYADNDNIRSGAFLFENARTKKAISRVQVYRIICAATKAVGIIARIACHGLRKTLGYHSWKDGKLPEIIMKMYNHSSLAITARYLGITQDDINAVYLGASY